jgi:hypothetical protein
MKSSSQTDDARDADEPSLDRFYDADARPLSSSSSSSSSHCHRTNSRGVDEQRQ